ncbi:MAG: YkvA family protein [Elusimicrobiota bacterium]
MLKKALARVRTEVLYYKALAAHERTPRVSKWLIGLAVVYLASPIDIIPDFIPVLGQLDDLAVVPFLIWLALKFIPEDVRRECRGGGR